MRVFDQRNVINAAKTRLLNNRDPQTRNRKCLGDYVTANFEYVPPLWELRVGDIRVFYEVDVQTELVYIHVVRRKPPGLTTPEVLNETNPR